MLEEEEEEEEKEVDVAISREEIGRKQRDGRSNEFPVLTKGQVVRKKQYRNSLPFGLMKTQDKNLEMKAAKVKVDLGFNLRSKGQW